MTTPTIVLTLPATYGWVGIAAFATIALTGWQTIKVAGARKAAGIKYPQLYAETHQAEKSRSAHIFNCTQRAHANTMESQPGVLFSTFVAGLKYPRAAAALCGIWTAARVVYTIGYCTGDPKKRSSGAAPAALALLGLYGLTAYTLFDLVAQNNFKF
ncbi:hypothetical protein OC846_003193 [Tilletia horrida]|uniref:Membrane-associated proteins in eicosanoid and glutathione metabolism n=1 Tax=Tilletia horrida TaxID=155126 RepID=A0AAN6GPY0_9BASI|nr:hypothetical protein OC845_003760 [Tilletia horrida]KAK0551701.1 hypothetical protein OC846_003193 [Tilletia horrida]KAK0569686.1 hypothetical protein OC861_000646 [Tilletia horrida]